MLRNPAACSDPGPEAGAYRKLLNRQAGQTSPGEVSPSIYWGTAAPERWPVHENGLNFEVSFSEGCSVGLFLDQRDNRRRLLTGHVAAGFPLLAKELRDRRLLNTFAYTCAFSVCAARSGFHTTSLDLSRKYLEWGRRNFVLNGLEPAQHDFIYGDVFDWLHRLARKGRQFEVVLLDPPTFSRSKQEGVFRAEKDYGKLVRTALPLLAPHGVLFASTNAARYAPEDFLQDVRRAVNAGGRRVLLQHYAPQPPDFPISRDEPAHLKTVWLRVG
jgi:23S rRNA (cytosine1962-C5)-methyltransferase